MTNREKALKTVLIVDDSPENLDIMRGILSPFYRVLVATNGRKALKVAMSPSRPDLILMDINMPEMDGYEACRLLKLDSRTSNIPILFVTAKSDMEDESQGFALGASDYLVKPVNPPIVLARVKTHLVIHDQVNLLANQIEMRTKQLELSNIELSEMRSTLYSIADAVISLDINNCVLLMNPVAEKLTGWGESEAHGKLLEEVFCIFNDETRSNVDNPRGWVLNEGDTKGMTTHALLIARDGIERSIGYSRSPIFNQDNNLLGDVLIFRDLTKEMEAEQAVLNQLAIIETYGGLVALANMDGKLIYVNAGGIKMLGATQPDDILAKNITDFVEQTNLKRETDELIPAAIKDRAWNGEHRLKRFDGTSIPVSKTLFIIPDAEGNPKHMGIIIMDISLQKESQEKLLVSEKLAVMGRILADVSHEINNPLAIVIGRTELILSDLDGQSTPFKAKLEVVLESARRCKAFLGYVNKRL